MIDRHTVLDVSSRAYRISTSVAAQVGVVLLSWLYVVTLHWHNDGLWFQGDAPRHAANGLFWWDFLTSLSFEPFEFALTYYARYPVINPTAYPPAFYVLEGVAFAAVGASPFVGKALVLVFALVAGLYVLAWLRRWMGASTGWAAALLVLQPGVIGWSHAVMLNIPCMALVLAALYHARRWLETPQSRHLYAAAAFTAMTILTYLTGGLVVFVVVAWVVIMGRWKALFSARSIAAWAGAGLVVLPWAIVVERWLSSTVRFTATQGGSALTLHRWTFYLHTLPHLFSIALLGVAVIGLVAGFTARRWRQEATLATVWLLVCYVGLSYIAPKDDRYLLMAAPAVVILGALGLVMIVARIPLSRAVHVAAATSVLSLLVVGFHTVRAHAVSVPFVDGFAEVVSFFERQAPNERIFYDGQYNGNFTFYLRAGDRNFNRSVTTGHKLLYPGAVMSGVRQADRVTSASEVVDVLRRECGCRWLAIETSPGSDAPGAARYLRQAVGGPEFELVTSYTLRSTTPIHIAIYRFRTPPPTRAEVDVRLPILGPNAEYRRRPIERDAAAGGERR